MQSQASLIHTRLNELRAWAVHFYTSLGLALGFLALLAIVEGRVRDIAVFLAIAAFIDGTDGPLARWSKVTRWTPQFDGRKLDDITDYLTYVLLPVFAIYRFGLVVEPWTPVLFLVLLAAAYGFCQQAAKTEDKYFTGFPNYWNVIAFYMYLLRLPPMANALILFLFALMVFVPVKYISSQTKPFRWLTLSVLVVWTAMILNILASLDQPNLAVVYGSLFAPAYYMGISLYLTYFWPHRQQR